MLTRNIIILRVYQQELYQYYKYMQLIEETVEEDIEELPQLSHSEILHAREYDLDV